MSVRTTIALTCGMVAGYLVAGSSPPALMIAAERGWAAGALAFALPEPSFAELPEWYRFRHALDECLDSMDQEP